MINFNKPPYIGEELDNIKQAVENLKICGDGPFTKKCNILSAISFSSNFL